MPALKSAPISMPSQMMPWADLQAVISISVLSNTSTPPGAGADDYLHAQAAQERKPLAAAHPASAPRWAGLRLPSLGACTQAMPMWPEASPWASSTLSFCYPAARDGAGPRPPHLPLAQRPVPLLQGLCPASRPLASSVLLLEHPRHAVEDVEMGVSCARRGLSCSCARARRLRLVTPPSDHPAECRPGRLIIVMNWYMVLYVFMATVLPARPRLRVYLLLHIRNAANPAVLTANHSPASTLPFFFRDVPQSSSPELWYLIPRPRLLAAALSQFLLELPRNLLVADLLPLHPAKGSSPSPFYFLASTQRSPSASRAFSSSRRSLHDLLLTLAALEGAA